MQSRSLIINSLYKLFHKELKERLDIQLSMDSSSDNSETLEAVIIDAKLLSEINNEKQIQLKIKNIENNSFAQLGKNLLGKRVLINDEEFCNVIEHNDIEKFDYVYDFIIIEGNLFNVSSYNELIGKKLSIRNSDTIYMYVQSSQLPRLSPFNRMNTKGTLMLFNFVITAKHDQYRQTIEDYTEAFYDIYYGTYKKTFPIIDEDGYLITETSSLNLDLSVNDYVRKTDEAIIRIVTIPIVVCMNYYQ